MLVPLALLSALVVIGVIYIFTELFITVFDDKLLKKTETFTIVTVVNASVISLFLYAFVLNFRSCL